MRKRRAILAAGAVLCLGLVGWLWPFEPEPGATLDNFRRLRHDMTLLQVEAILGSPGQPILGGPGDGDCYTGVLCWSWHCDSRSVAVFPDKVGCLGSAVWTDHTYPQTDERGSAVIPRRVLEEGTFLDRLGRLLPW
jgi:hypothetical protein